MRNVISIPTAGIVIPMDRVDYYRWQAQAVQHYRIEIGADEINPFRLHDQQKIIFQQFVYRLGSAEPFMMDQQEYITKHNVEVFLSSALFGALSSRSQERITEVLQAINKSRRRIQHAEAELEKLRQLLGDTADGNLDMDQIREERARRTRQLNRRLAELQTFTDSKSGQLTELVNISDMRQTDWWTADADEFFEQIMLENAPEKNAFAKAPEVQPAEAPVAE